jgi:hypothetical protein
MIGQGCSMLAACGAHYLVVDHLFDEKEPFNPLQSTSHTLPMVSLLERQSLYFVVNIFNFVIGQLAVKKIFESKYTINKLEDAFAMSTQASSYKELTDLSINNRTDDDWLLKSTSSPVKTSSMRSSSGASGIKLDFNLIPGPKQWSDEKLPLTRHDSFISRAE